jgi:uncharacterized protein YpmB
METGVIVVIGLIVLFILFRIFKAFLKWGIIILLIGLVAAYFTNPSETVHRESFKLKAKELSLKRTRQKDLTIDDYKLFSLSKINADGEQKLVGIGAFGKVWYFADLKEKIRKK